MQACDAVPDSALDIRLEPMSSEPITSVFNDGYIAEAYESFRRDPSSVEESWRQFFRFAESLSGTAPAAGVLPAVSVGKTDASLLRKVAGAAALVQSIRAFGHLAAQIDPLGNKPPGTQELTLEFHGLTQDDLAAIPGEALGFKDGTAAEAVDRLRKLYSGDV